MATRVPEYRISMKDFYREMKWYFNDPGDEEFLGKVIPATRIETKYYAVNPSEYYQRGRLFVDHTMRHRDWRTKVTEICTDIARELMEKGGIKPSDVGLISFNSTTGCANPDIPARVAANLGMPHWVRRTQILHQGCYGSVPNMVRCVEGLLGKRTSSYALALTSELCSLTLEPSNKEKDYKVAVVLFGDGSAGVLLKRIDYTLFDILGSEKPSKKIPTVIDYETYTDFKTLSEMSFELINEGFHFVLSRNVPSLLGEVVHRPVNRILKRNSLEMSDIDHWLIHPGGVAILQAVCDALKLDLEETCKISLEVNRKCGNMSSATILFCLQEFLERGLDGRVMLLTFGPGLTVELVLLEI